MYLFDANVSSLGGGGGGGDGGCSFWAQNGCDFFHICGNFVGLDRHIIFRFQNYCQRIPISLFSRFSAS